PVPVFINDRMDIAMISGAAGVHLGESDLPPATARRIAPAGFVIGATVGNDEEALRGITADYWGIGPRHGSRTKRDAGAALGMDRATELRLMGRVPAVLIGGVEPSD